jgi:hypothetical protein
MLNYQYAERIKSELIIATKLLERLSGLKDDELFGAEKLMSWFLDALLSEIEIAYDITRLRCFRDASLRVMETNGRINLHDYPNANICLSEAISFITTCAQYAYQLIKETGYLAR